MIHLWKQQKNRNSQEHASGTPAEVHKSKEERNVLGRVVLKEKNAYCSRQLNQVGTAKQPFECNHCLCVRKLATFNQGQQKATREVASHSEGRAKDHIPVDVTVQKTSLEFEQELIEATTNEK